MRPGSGRDVMQGSRTDRRRRAGSVVAFVGFVVAIGMLGVDVASAQVVTNPTRVDFRSADHAKVDRYEGGYFAIALLPAGGCDPTAAAAEAPTQLEDLSRPEEVEGLVTAPLTARPLGCYRYKVRAFGAGLWSDWSDPSGPFANPPRAPVVDAVRK